MNQKIKELIVLGIATLYFFYNFATKDVDFINKSADIADTCREHIKGTDVPSSLCSNISQAASLAYDSLTLTDTSYFVFLLGFIALIGMRNSKLEKELNQIKEKLDA